MTTKELRQSLRRGSFIYPFLGIQLLAVFATAIEFQNGTGSMPSNRLLVPLNPFLLMHSGPFWAIAGVICAVIIPLGGFMLMGQELEEGNHELLLLTHLSRWRVVIGKMLTLWGLCVLTLVSLLPYVIVRYMVGGVEWWYEFCCFFTVMGLAAIVCSGAIAASAYTHMGFKISILLIFLISAAIGGFTTIAFSGSKGIFSFFGTTFQVLNSLGEIIGFTACGLAIARSKIRLSLDPYEVRPSRMLVTLLLISPFFLAFMTAITLGKLGFLGTLGLALISIRLDVTPKAPKWVAAPAPNIPVPPPLPPSLPPGVES
ncbi:hypothetical protein JIN85_09995 [Luteolibacter pohnpeiensis]|uniref:ABC transporter permease n=1 Tax=Luteolibacter pohnpeiensis TaxID=454153 RepID=A0A934SAQ8_9BACT|nr:ABC transporter permease subunit [Luteolibacter pohnpeiensis]MBK1882747.1 hypothetical protein [Luteolibacter pohnpeiensis]